MAEERTRPGAATLWESEHLRLKRCLYGPMLYSKHDTHVGHLLDNYGEYSVGEVEFFAQMIRPGHTVIDAGANVGALAVPLGQLVGPAGTVHAFEPQPHVWRLLVANTVMNGLDWVKCWNCAVGDQSRRVGVALNDPTQPQNFGGFTLLRGGSDAELPMMVIDDLDLAKCRLIKADVEGMEAQLLKGALETVKRCRPVLYLEAEITATVPPVLELLAELGYVGYWHLTPYIRSRNFFRQDIEPAWQGIGAMNIIAGPADFQVGGARPVRTGDWRVDCAPPP